MNRNGKIARPPHGIREQLNRRLQDNEPGDKLLEWLNGQEAVQTVLKEQFEGKAITKQNLSEWRTGGFAEWVLAQEVVYEAQDTDEGARRLDAVTDSSLPDRLATVLAGRYASLLARWDGEVTEAFTKKLRALGPLCRAICALRQSHHNAIKIKIARELHAERHDGKGERGKEEGGRKPGKRPGTSDASESVKPGQTSFRPNPEMTTPDDVATSCREPDAESGKEEGRVKNEEWGKGEGNPAPSGSVAPGLSVIAAMATADQTELSPEARGAGHEAGKSDDVAASGHQSDAESGMVEGKMKNEELENSPRTSDHSESVAPALSAIVPQSGTKADQSKYESPITDHRIYPPMASSDPNSRDIYAIDTVPKKRNPDNYVPDLFSFPSYWHWVKTCKPKVLPPNHPAKPPTQYTT